jgi:hypothetical protein
MKLFVVNFRSTFGQPEGILVDPVNHGQPLVNHCKVLFINKLYQKLTRLTRLTRIHRGQQMEHFFLRLTDLRTKKSAEK